MRELWSCIWGQARGSCEIYRVFLVPILWGLPWLEMGPTDADLWQSGSDQTACDTLNHQRRRAQPVSDEPQFSKLHVFSLIFSTFFISFFFLPRQCLCPNLMLEVVDSERKGNGLYCPWTLCIGTKLMRHLNVNHNIILAPSQMVLFNEVIFHMYNIFWKIIYHMLSGLFIHISCLQIWKNYLFSNREGSF